MTGTYDIKWLLYVIISFLLTAKNFSGITLYSKKRNNKGKLD